MSSRKHKKDPLPNALARDVLSLLSHNLLPACAQDNRIDVHALAYPVGRIFHMPHGLSTSLVLPQVLRFNRSEAAQLYAELAGVVVPHASGSVEARTEALLVAMQQMARMTEIETSLRQVGITGAHLDRLADDAMLQTRLLGNNPRTLTCADALAIYAAAL